MEFQRYFQSYQNYFWEWDNQLFSEDEVFEAIVIPNGKTIAYEKYVFEILEFLSEDSLPPFGSLLLAVIATNHESQDALEMVNEIVNQIVGTKLSSENIPEDNSFKGAGAFTFLKVLSSLPEEYKTGEKRLQLFQTIFHGSHKRVASDKAKKILEEYKQSRHHLVRASVKDDFNAANFVKDFRTIALLLAKFPTVQSIIDAMENLPDQEIQKQLSDDVFEVQPSDTPGDFIEELIKEEKTFQVGSLVKRIWSGLNIPLHHNMPSAQPLGGISDLTNKGDFDKLVISEFANDDDVFMSRIANNEALYIQREVPPEADKFRRTLLIDTTLINWGNPKILAFASAIAIASHPKTDIECEIFVVGDSYQKIDLENVDQVINSLGELSGKLCCSEGLDLFFAENPVNPKQQEVFLISSDESLKLQLMQKAMSDYFNSIKYVFVTNVEGSISIFKNQNKGRKLLQQIIMPLDELWKKDNVKRENIVNVITDNSIPLLFPAERDYTTIFNDSNNHYLYSGGNLFMFHKEGFQKGFKKMASNLPFKSGEFAIRSNSKGELLLLNYHYNSRIISIINLAANQFQSHKVFSDDEHTKLSFFEYQHQFYLTNNIDFWKVANNCYIDSNVDTEVIEAFDEKFAKQAAFIRNYKGHYISKYTLIKRLESVSLVNNQFEINNFQLDATTHLGFRKAGRYRSDQIMELMPRVNLVLKNRGVQPVSIINLIKENTNKTLAEANRIVDENQGLILENALPEDAQKLKIMIENMGAICYIETKCFESGDGSRILIKDGILVFESSDKQLPVFYIPFVTAIMTAMVSQTEFAGNAYFISEEHSQESIDKELFYKKYIKPFILNLQPWN
jgi:ribosomal protein L7/L12